MGDGAREDEASSGGNIAKALCIETRFGEQTRVAEVAVPPSSSSARAPNDELDR